LISPAPSAFIAKRNPPHEKNTHPFTLAKDPQQDFGRLVLGGLYWAVWSILVECTSEVAVRHLADIRHGERLLSLDLDRIVASVKRHPWIAEARIKRSFPDTVQIQVEEHKAVLLLAHRGLFFVSDNGEVFVRARTLGDLPLLTGVGSERIDKQPAVAKRIIKDALDVLASVNASSALGADALSEIRFDEKLGFSLHLRNHSRIHLGFRSPGDQMARLEQMLRKGLDLSAKLEVDLDLENMAIATPLSG
jgi:cell division septal protein FtsQ